MSARKCAAYMCVCEWGAGVVKQSGLISDWWQLCDWCNVGWEWVCCSAVNDGSCSPWVMCSCSVVRGNQIRDRHSVSHCSRLRKITVQYESHPLILCRDWRMHFHTKKTVHLYIHCDFLIAKNGYIYFQWFSFLIPSSQNNKLIFHRPKNSSINPYIKNSTFCSSLKPFEPYCKDRVPSGKLFLSIYQQRKSVHCSELAWFAWAYCTMQQFPNTCHKTKVLTKMKGPTSERERKSSPNSGSENDSIPDRNSKGKRNDENTSVAGCITHASVLATDFTETEPPAGDWNREDTSFIQNRLFCCCCCSFVKNMMWLWLEH